MAKLLIISNGHGEDLSGALLGRSLSALNHQVDSLPLVGRGKAYSDCNISTLGRTKEFSTGGIGYTSIYGRLTELFQGQVFYLLRKFFHLLVVAPDYDLLIVIGDVVPVMLAWLTGRPVATYLVAYSSHYEGKLRLPWPCSYLLSSSRFRRIYSRDQFTADDLSMQLRRHVAFLGNPFMDPVLVKQPPLPVCDYRLGLLPGSRRPELDDNILLMLRVFETFRFSGLSARELTIDMALVSSLSDSTLESLANSRGWKLVYPLDQSSLLQLVDDQTIINVHRTSFLQVLQSSDLLLCMAGTATEQAVGLGKPVLQLPGHGPQFTASFAEAQRRLLGPTVFCADGEAGAELNLRNTANMIFDLLQRSSNDVSLKEECHYQSKMRLGDSGGCKGIAKDINDLIKDIGRSLG